MLKRSGSFYGMDTDEDDEVIREREYRGVKAIRRDPFGFWSVPVKHPIFDGVFSTIAALEKAIDAYLYEQSKLPKRKEKPAPSPASPEV